MPSFWGLQLTHPYLVWITFGPPSTSLVACLQFCPYLILHSGHCGVILPTLSCCGSTLRVFSLLLWALYCHHYSVAHMGQKTCYGSVLCQCPRNWLVFVFWLLQAGLEVLFDCHQCMPNMLHVLHYYSAHLCQSYFIWLPSVVFAFAFTDHIMHWGTPVLCLDHYCRS